MEPESKSAKRLTWSTTSCDLVQWASCYYVRDGSTRTQNAYFCVLAERDEMRERKVFPLFCSKEVHNRKKVHSWKFSFFLSCWLYKTRTFFSTVYIKVAVKPYDWAFSLLMLSHYQWESAFFGFLISSGYGTTVPIWLLHTITANCFSWL